MEQKFIRVPFNVELARKITNGEEEGRIVTRDGRNTRILCFDAKMDDNIVALVECEKGGEFDVTYNSTGRCFFNYEDEDDLFLEIPEYMTFKDGDVYTTLRRSVGIYNSNYTTSRNSIPFYVGKRYDGELIFRKDGDFAGFGSVTESTLSTEAEKQKLIDALKASDRPEAKEYLKRFFGIEVKQEFEFKPFDKVLVRDYNGDWIASIFSHKSKKGRYYCCGGYGWEQCLPYNEETKHLLGTTDSYDKQ